MTVDMRADVILITFATLVLCSDLVYSDDVHLENEQKEYLRKFGYLQMKKDSPFISSMTSSDVLMSAIKDFQRMAGLEQTGVMDGDTRSMMSKPRCGVSDLQGSSPRRRKRYVLYGTKWNEMKLKYKLINHAKGLPKIKVESTIDRAFGYWQNVSGLTFEKTSGNAIIDIAFKVGAHGDEDAFDGAGGTLAHAFFPTQNSIGGDMHFDDEEMWTFEERRGTNLLQVTVHELGHSLGLSHSDVKGSIMAPFYREYDPNLKLHDDDVKGIQKLYGPPASQNNKPPVSMVTSPPNNKGICQIKKPDAIFSFFDLLFVFQGDKLFAMNGFYDDKAKEYTPSVIFPKLPSNIDAAFSYDYVTSKNIKYDLIYFFKGDQVWQYLYRENPFGFSLMTGYPKLISKEFPGIPNNLDGAFEWNLNGKKYFFKGNQYYRFSESLTKVATTYPRSITNWNLKIDKVDSVFNYPSKGISDTYFTSDGLIYKYDEVKDEVAHGFPRSLEWFFGCFSKVESLKGIEEFSNSPRGPVLNIFSFIVAFLICSHESMYARLYF